VRLPWRYATGDFSITIRIASLPVVESELALGVYLVTDKFDGNILDLVELTVAAPRPATAFTAYPAHARGLMTLDAVASVNVGKQAVAV